MKRIIMGCDHAAYHLKEKVKTLLEEKGHTVEDKGCHSTESVDYPDYARAVGAEVAGDENALGILICGTGIGISIAANKMKGIRAALCHTEFEARMCRNHNNANVLCLGARVIGQDLAFSVVDAYLEASFEGGRHGRRVDKMMALEG